MHAPHVNVGEPWQDPALGTCPIHSHTGGCTAPACPSSLLPPSLAQELFGDKEWLLPAEVSVSEMKRWLKGKEAGMLPRGQVVPDHDSPIIASRVQLINMEVRPLQAPAECSQSQLGNVMFCDALSMHPISCWRSDTVGQYTHNFAA
jgi:hypothetical protein